MNEYYESDNNVEDQDPVKMQPTDFNPSQISNKKKLWECQECGKFFSVKGNMKRHNKTFHKESNSTVESFSSSTDAEKHVSSVKNIGQGMRMRILHFIILFVNK